MQGGVTPPPGPQWTDNGSKATPKVFTHQNLCTLPSFLSSLTFDPEGFLGHGLGLVEGSVLSVVLGQIFMTT